MSGVYALPAGSIIANGDTSDASDLNTPLADLETDANTARPVSVGGTGAATASDARTNLGLAIGSDVQAYDADLTALAALASTGIVARTASATYALRTLTAGSGISVADGDGVAGNPTISVSGLTTAEFSAATLVIASDTIASNDNDTTVPTSAAVIDHVDMAIGRVLHVQDQKSSGTDGGTFTSGAWRTRTLTTAVTNTISGASIASNQITLPAGTYDVYITCPGHTVDLHQARLYNISDSALAILGTSMFAHASNGVTNVSVIHGRITIAGTKVFEIQHRCQTTKATTGFGDAANFGDGEIYTDARFAKIS